MSHAKTSEPPDIREMIKRALKDKDVSYAHVLLHSMIRVYGHTPYPVRKARLLKYASEFPTLAACCLKSCSQTGRAKGEA